METVIDTVLAARHGCQQSLAGVTSKATTHSNGEPATLSSTNKEEVTLVAPPPPHFFRPIKFESTPATPESNGGSENGSSGGSETTIDSAYGSEEIQATARTGSHGGDTAGNPVTAEEEAEEPIYTGDITVHLQNKSLWKSFRKIGNEMIVTKPGRLVAACVCV